MEAEVLSSYSKQADNVFISVEVMDFIYYEEANVEQTVATEVRRPWWYNLTYVSIHNKLLTNSHT